MLFGRNGLEDAGFIRFGPSELADADAALAWLPDDVLSSTRATMQRGHAVGRKESPQAQAVRRWIVPPCYDVESHQLAWTALTLPKTAPRESDAEIIYHAIGFGRQGRVQLKILASVQRAEVISR